MGEQLRTLGLAGFFAFTQERFAFGLGFLQVLFEGAPERSLWAMLVTLGRRYDTKQWFEGTIDVTVPRKFWFELWDMEK